MMISVINIAFYYLLIYSVYVKLQGTSIFITLGNSVLELTLLLVMVTLLKQIIFTVFKLFILEITFCKF